MKALTFHFSYPRFVAGKLFGGLSRGGPLVYEDVPDAKLLGDDWVIVETRYCGICGKRREAGVPRGRVRQPDDGGDLLSARARPRGSSAPSSRPARTCAR